MNRPFSWSMTVFNQVFIGRIHLCGSKAPEDYSCKVPQSYFFYHGQSDPFYHTFIRVVLDLSISVRIFVILDIFPSVCIESELNFNNFN